MATYKQMQAFSDKIPEGDDRLRSVCDHCGYVSYVNPKILVGSVVSYEGRILLCKRAIEPRRGYWTLPAGFLELGETPEDGALREAREEACAALCIERLLCVYSVLEISQVQLIFKATLQKGSFRPGPESLDVRLFSWDEIPWENLAFPTVGWALRHWKEHADHDCELPFSNPEQGM